MKRYISYGGGVNSTAMIIHMVNEGISFDEIIFADTGAEWPETIEYLDYFEKEYLKSKGMPITRISAMDMGMENNTLLGFFQRYSMTPSRMFRACTDRFKVSPILKYYETPCIQYLGIDAGESHRAKPARSKDYANEFPLIEAGITRRMCVDIIRTEGLCVPKKSGCYFCAFARIGQYKELYQVHPKLFSIVLELEKAHHQRHNLGKWANEPGKHIFIKDKPMWELAERFKAELEGEEMQLELFDDPQDSMNCLCKFA